MGNETDPTNKIDLDRPIPRFTVCFDDGTTPMSNPVNHTETAIFTMRVLGVPYRIYSCINKSAYVNSLQDVVNIASGKLNIRGIDNGGRKRLITAFDEFFQLVDREKENSSGQNIKIRLPSPKIVDTKSKPYKQEEAKKSEIPPAQVLQPVTPFNPPSPDQKDSGQTKPTIGIEFTASEKQLVPQERDALQKELKMPLLPGELSPIPFEVINSDGTPFRIDTFNGIRTFFEDIVGIERRIVDHLFGTTKITKIYDLVDIILGTSRVPRLSRPDRDQIIKKVELFNDHIDDVFIHSPDNLVSITVHKRTLVKPPASNTVLFEGKKVKEAATIVPIAITPTGMSENQIIQTAKGKAKDDQPDLKTIITNQMDYTTAENYKERQNIIGMLDQLVTVNCRRLPVNRPLNEIYEYLRIRGLPVKVLAIDGGKNPKKVVYVFHKKSQGAVETGIIEVCQPKREVIQIAGPQTFPLPSIQEYFGTSMASFYSILFEIAGPKIRPDIVRTLIQRFKNEVSFPIYERETGPTVIPKDSAEKCRALFQKWRKEILELCEETHS